MEFIKKEQLEKEYIAFGRFYILKYDNGIKKCCRSILEILERNSCESLKDTNKIDAVFVMMNPGSGTPIREYNQKCININQLKCEELCKIHLVETDPDDTRYQVMRVMRIMKWKYVRVINLSDYRNPKSKNFYSMLDDAKSYDSKFVHSIFLKERKIELNAIFKSDKKYKVITAWGVNTKLNKLIQLALQNKNLSERIGNNKVTYKRKKEFYYYHPLPTNPLKQPLWLEEIVERLQSKEDLFK